MSGLQASLGDAEEGTEKKEMSLSGRGAGGWRGGEWWGAGRQAQGVR